MKANHDLKLFLNNKKKQNESKTDFYKLQVRLLRMSTTKIDPTKCADAIN